MPANILIIDDDPVITRLLKSFLKNNDFKVDSAADGLDGLVKLKKTHPDLVLLDVMLPEVNGYDICYQLRFNDEFKKIPIILMTSRQQELGEKMSRRVNIAYLQKPIDTKKLLRKINGLLEP